MKAERPNGTDEGTRRGVSSAIHRAFNKPLLIDQAADADLARLIDRLRAEPGSKGGNQ